MNAIPMIEACARHQGGIRTRLDCEVGVAWGGVVGTIERYVAPTDRGIEGYHPLPPEVPQH